MGNNNSRQKNKIDIVSTTNDDNPELLNQFYAEDPVNQARKLKANIHATADRFFDKIWDNSNVESYTDKSRGIKMPYISDKNLYGSETEHNPFISSENPAYIDFIVNNNDADIQESYAVNKNIPDHDCKANCHCIKKVTELLSQISNRNDEINLEDTDKIDIDSMNRNLMLMSVTSEDDDVGKLPNRISLRNDPGKTTLMALKNNPDRGSKTVAVNNIWSNNTRMNDAYSCKIHLKGGCGCAGKKMAGGANNESDDTSEDNTDDSNDNMYDSSDTSEDSNYNPNNGDNKKNQKKKKVIGDETSDNDILDSDESDDINEELDVDEEDISEDGYVIHSDITSSDLYNLQSKIFESDTEDSDEDARNFAQVSRVKKNINKMNDRILDDDDEITEEIRMAMREMNERDQMFDTETREIFRMNSDSDHYLKRSLKRNNKYH